MGTTLELVYQYRQLLGRCDAGTGLDFDEIDTLNTVEALLNSQPPIAQADWRSVESSPAIMAVLRGVRIDDDVTIFNLGLSGCVCRNAPYAQQGATVEIVINDREQPVSYRFKAQVVWLEEDDDDYCVLGLEFVGVPIQVRYRPGTEPSPATADQIAA